MTILRERVAKERMLWRGLGLHTHERIEECADGGVMIFGGV